MYHQRLSLAQYVTLLSWLLSLPTFPPSKWTGLVRPIKCLPSLLSMLFSDNGHVLSLSFQCVSTHWQQSGGTQQFIITPFRYGYWTPLVQFSTLSYRTFYLWLGTCISFCNCFSFSLVWKLLEKDSQLLLKISWDQALEGWTRVLPERRSHRSNPLPAIPHIHNSSQYTKLHCNQFRNYIALYLGDNLF